MPHKKTSSGETLNRYMKGFIFWNTNAFWRDPSRNFSDKAKQYFEKWLFEMRANEKHLTKLEPSMGKGVRV